MEFDFCEVSNVRAFWLWKTDRYYYKSIPNTILTNRDAGSLRVTLRDSEKSEDVEIIFICDDNGYHCRFDDNEIMLKKFESGSNDDMILYYEDNKIPQEVI